MQSGIGDQTELQRLGIPVAQHLPGVDQNFQVHVAFDCVWEYGGKNTFLDRPAQEHLIQGC
jgi:choline dehydrogenase-like flavoprotein